jgi:hypothetical protein
MSREASSIVRGIKAAPDIRSSGPAAGGRYLLPEWQKVKVSAGLQTRNDPGGQPPGSRIAFGQPAEAPLAVATAMSATTMASATGTATAGASATRMTTETGTSTAGTNHYAAATTVPAMPAGTTAPAEAAAPGVTAPIITRTLPAIVVPAIVAAAEEELGLFDLSRDSSRREAVKRKRIRLPGNAQKCERSSSSVNPLSHNISVSFLSRIRWLLRRDGPDSRLDNEVDCREFDGRSGRARTYDPRFWRPVLYQLSYTPAGNLRRRRSVLFEA